MCVEGMVACDDPRTVAKMRIEVNFSSAFVLAIAFAFPVLVPGEAALANAASRPRELASERTSGSWPAWSPNGRRIVFTSLSVTSCDFEV
ncbi:MAG: hypothetical protein E6G02_12310 [Actinobacteria bacterium]|nr:MAG: hypothetical protein E6G02_12310 [Actinomycetota bacterium]